MDKEKEKDILEENVKKPPDLATSEVAEAMEVKKKYSFLSPVIVIINFLISGISTSQASKKEHSHASKKDLSGISTIQRIIW